MNEGFLERWSRLKREAETAPDAPEHAEPAGPEELTEEEIAALPRPEELTADSDVTCFLRPGVPAGLRNAALRRMWLLDPAIRDFVGPARDYSYDWNLAGGVPGSGPLDSTEAVAALLRGVFGDAGPRQEPPAQSSPATDDVVACEDRPSASGESHA